VLRYLAENLAKELDTVLAGILRSLNARRTVAIHPLIVVRGSRQSEVQADGIAGLQ
jgi:hypothetical protein